MKSGSNAWLHAFFSRSNDKDVTWKTSPNPVFELEDEPDNIDTYFPIHLYLCLQTFGCASILLSSQVPIQLKTSETQPKVWASFQEQKERESSSLFGSEVVEHLWINIYGYKQPFNSFCFIFKKKKKHLHTDLPGGMLVKMYCTPLERAREGEYELQHSLGFCNIAAALN